MDSQIPLSIPEIAGNEWHYVKECLDSGWISSVGAYVERFERSVAQITKRKYAVATVNGTAALHTSLIVAGVKPGEEVLTTSLTFIAPANAIRYCGAFPIFVDCTSTAQMDFELLRTFLREHCQRTPDGVTNRDTKRRIAAILPVNVVGAVGDIQVAESLAHEFELPLIVDATESLGSTHAGRPASSYGRMAALSFNGNKILSTGGGGMIVTDDAHLAERAKHLTTQAKDDAFEYIHHQIGYNYRLPNVLAAIGCAQLEKLEEYVLKKKKIALLYREALSDLRGVEMLSEEPKTESNCWLNVLRLKDPIESLSRPWMVELHRQKIESRPFWQPMHLSPAHRNSSYFGQAPSQAQMLYESCLCLPSSVGLTRMDQDRVIRAILVLHQDTLESRRRTV